MFNYLNGNEYGVNVLIQDNYILVNAVGITNPDSVDYKFANYLLAFNDENTIFYPFYNNIFDLSPFNGVYVYGDTIYMFGSNYSQFPYDYKIFKTNMQADSLGEIVLKHDGVEAYSDGMVVANDNIFVFGERINAQERYDLNFIKMTLGGKIIKERRFNNNVNTRNNYGTSLVLTRDGNLAYSSFLRDGKARLVGVTKMDMDLNPLWQVYFPPFGEYPVTVTPKPIMATTKDGGLVICSKHDIYDSLLYHVEKYVGKDMFPIIITKLRQDGAIEWSDTLLTNVFQGHVFGPQRTYNKIRTCRNGDILLIGTYNYDIADIRYFGLLTRYSPDGKKKWEKYYVDINYCLKYGADFLDAREADNGDIICTGSIEDSYNSYGNDRQYTWLLRVDSMGCYVPGCQTTDSIGLVIITSTEEINMNLTSNIACYPNPAQDMINISVPEGFVAEVAEVYDIMGKKVMITERKFEEIDISYLETGLYIVVVKDKSGSKMRGKFVKAR